MQFTVTLAPAVSQLTAREFAYAIQGDYSASFELKRMIEAAGKRDPLDAVRDLEVALAYARKRAGETIGAAI